MGFQGTDGMEVGVFHNCVDSEPACSFPHIVGMGLLSETQTLHLKPVPKSVWLVRTCFNIENYTGALIVGVAQGILSRSTFWNFPLEAGTIGGSSRALKQESKYPKCLAW